MTQTILKPRQTPRSDSYRSDKPSRVRPEFADYGDLDARIKCFEQTGQFYPAEMQRLQNAAQPVFLDVSQIKSFEDVASLMRRAEDSFQAMPSSVKAYFQGSSVAFMSALSDPTMRKALIEKGVLPKECLSESVVETQEQAPAPAVDETEKSQLAQ